MVLTAAPAPATADSASLTRHTYAAPDEAFSRDYLVYAPSSKPAQSPLVVYLHGCTQDATQAAVGTRWNELADERGFVVAYPEQAAGNDEQDATVRSLEGSANGARCWNWFRPSEHTRQGGEVSTIAGITREAIAAHDVDPRRVYVVGASAGANMATNLAATYPDLFAASGAFAGCPFLACGDHAGVAAFEAMGAHARRRPAFVVDGTAETANPYAMAEALAQQWLGTNDLADNGSADNSIDRSPATVEHHGLDATLVSGLGSAGDACIRPMQWPCAAGVLGASSYPYSVRTWNDADGETLVELWTIHGLSHNYPGGDPEGTFTDPHGPNVNEPMYAFFLANPGPPLPAVEPLDLEISSTRVREGDRGTTRATLVVSLSGPSASPVRVRFATADATAVAPGDYGARSAMLTLRPGERSRSIGFSVKADRREERNESFVVRLTDASGADVVRQQGRVVIVDDD